MNTNNTDNTDNVTNKPHVNYYYIAHLSRDQVDNQTWCITYVMDNPEYRKDVCEYWSTPNIFEAKKFKSKEEVFGYLLNNPQLFDGAILKEYTDEYLESIRNNKSALWYISHPITRDYVKCPFEK